MASTYHLVCDSSYIITHIITKDRECEQDRRKYHTAALKIQVHWRGYIARKQKKIWIRAATILQKYIRRFLVKIHMANYMLEHLQNVNRRYYAKMATKLQALWRGYIYRTKVMNFHAMYQNRMRVLKINEEMMQRMRKEKARSDYESKLKIEEEAQVMILFILFKLHHHLKTETRVGIYSIPESSNYSWIEQLLQSVKYTDYMKRLKQKYNESYTESEERTYLLKGRWRVCEKAYYERDKSNEPKVTKRKDQYKNQYINEKPFCLDPRMYKKYERYALTTEDYLPAITDIVRDINMKLNICDKDFDLTKRMVKLKSKIPPYYVEYFDKTCKLHNIKEDVNIFCNKKK